MKLKRYLSILMALCMVLTLLPVGTLATEAEGEPELVDGYYEIYTADQLYWFAEQVNSGNTAINGRLMADIVVNENVMNDTDGINDFRTWTPIGTAENPYNGSFDGQWRTIVGLYFEDESNIENVGLFGTVGEAGMVGNLMIIDSYFVSGSVIGTVAADNSGSIYNCYVSESGIFGGNAVGGVVGRNDGQVECCQSDMLIYGDYFVGGIVGLSEAGGSIADCINDSNVTATNDNSYVGGIAGWATENEISCCENWSYITGLNYIGGIAGHSYDSQIANCINSGSISGESDCTGGIVGLNSYGSVDNCFNEGTVYISKLYVEGKITIWLDMDCAFTPYAWAWGDYGDAFDEWPGEPMEKDGDLWKIQVPSGSTGLVFSNAGADQSPDIEIVGFMDCVIRVPVDYSEYTIEYNGYGGGVDPSVDKIDVWVDMDCDFTPYAWAWGLYGDAFYEWPGEPMEQVGNLWKIELPVGFTGFIVNDGSYAQTWDIMIDGYMDCLITVSEDFSEFAVSYDGFERKYYRPICGGAIAGDNTGSVSDCYYSWNENPLSNSHGTPLTNMECASGLAAYLLQGQQEKPIWGQDLLWDTMPSLHGPRVEPVYDQEENIIGFQNEVIPSVTGSVTSYLNNAAVTIELLQDGELIDSTTIRGKNVEFAFYEVGAGTYTLRISKDNHPTREYEVVVEAEDVFVEAELCPYGDVTGDGNINVKDFQRLLRHVNKTNPLTGYALACGDVTGDGNANIKDFQRLLRHVNKTGLLYPETKDVTIKVWAPSEDLSWGYGWMQEMQSRFEAMHPEYSISWVNESMLQGDAGYYVMQDAQSAADVYMYASDMQYRLVQAGGLMPLTGAYADQVRNDNVQVGVNSVTHTDGQLYGFPMENNTWFLYYDNRVFTEEDVTNLDVMLEKGRVSLPYDNAWMAGAFFLGCGGTLFGENGLDADAGIDFSGSNGGYMAAKKMVELAQHPNAEFGAYNIGGMVDGTVDAIFSGSWDAAALRDILGDALGVAMLPKFTIDGEEYQMTAMSGTMCVGVNPYADDEEGKLDLCMEFASFLASEEGQLERYEMRGVIPTHKNLADNEVIQADAVAMAEINTMRYASVVQPGLDEMSYYWSPMGNFGAAVVMGDVTLENYKQMVDELAEAFHA